MKPPIPFLDETLDHLRPLVEGGVLGSPELAVVSALTDTDTPDEATLALALTVLGLRVGHSCIELVDAALLRDTILVGVDDEADVVAARAVVFPDPADWVRILETSELVEVDDGAGGPLQLQRPLVLDPKTGRLWLARYAYYEQDLAERLVARSGGSETDANPTGGEGGAAGVVSGGAPGSGRGNDVFTDADPDERSAAVDAAFEGVEPSEAQRASVEQAISRRLTIVTGGPGTGKTWTVGRIVAAATALGVDTDRIALAAPTGKAADRLAEEIRVEMDDAATDPGGSGSGGEEASPDAGVWSGTIHRLLAINPGRPARPGEAAVVSHDLVIVDEASMIDLPLMARLVGAIRPEAHLVVVGDPDQLESVDVGSVLGDIVAAGESDADSPRIPPPVRLTEVRRRDEDNPINDFANAIRIGDVERCRGAIDGTTIRLVHPTDDREVDGIVRGLVDAGRRQVEAATNDAVDSAFEAAESHRVLTATRHDRDRWGTRLRGLLGFREGEWRIGRPIMITRNDLANGVFNGDTGIVMPDAADGEPKVAFRSGQRIPPSSLGDHEDWWSMTIHKSQGSEYDHVVVVLPNGPSPLLSRQLLYTAVTRARSRVTIVATNDVFDAAVATDIRRSSGLAERLTRPGGDEEESGLRRGR